MGWRVWDLCPNKGKICVFWELPITHTPLHWVPGSFLRGRGWSPHLVPRLRMSVAKPPLLLYAFRACIRPTLPFLPFTSPVWVERIVSPRVADKTQYEPWHRKQFVVGSATDCSSHIRPQSHQKQKRTSHWTLMRKSIRTCYYLGR